MQQQYNFTSCRVPLAAVKRVFSYTAHVLLVWLCLGVISSTLGQNRHPISTTAIPQGNGVLTTPQVDQFYNPAGGATVGLTNTVTLGNVVPSGTPEVTAFGAGFPAAGTLTPLSAAPLFRIMNLNGFTTANFSAWTAGDALYDPAQNNGNNFIITSNGLSDATQPPVAGTRYQRADITFTFSKAVTNPVMHISGIGGSITYGTNKLGLSTSYDIVTGGLTLTKLNGNTGFNVSSTSITNGNAIFDGTNGTGAVGGSVRINGTFTTVTFRVYLQGDGNFTTYGWGTNANALSSGAYANRISADGIWVSFTANIPPVATTYTTSTISNIASTPVAISPALSGTDDGGTIANYTITSLPTNGTIYCGGTLISTVPTNCPTNNITYLPNSGTLATSDSFQYKVIDDLGESSTAAATVTIPLACPAISAPTSATGTPSTICQGASSVLSASCTAGYTPTWYSDAGLTSPLGSTTVSPSSTTTYHVACVSGICKSAGVSATVTVNAAPVTPSPSPTTLTTCAPGTVSLTGTLGTAPAGTVYEWHTANNTLAGTIVSTPTAVSTSGTYYVFSKNSTTSCYSTGSGSVVVTINAAPATPSPSPTTLTTCAPGTVDLTSTLGTAPAGTVYEWHTANNTLAGTIVSTPTAVGTAGTYYVFSKNSTTSCYSTGSGSVVVTINAAPATPSPSPTTLTTCAPGTVDLTSTLGTAPAGTVYEWHTANNTLAGTIVSTPTAVSSSGTYYVFSKNSTTSCYSTGSGSVVVTINAAPATPSPSPTTLTTCAPGTVDLTSTLGTAPAGTVYEWHTANNTLAGTIVSTPTAVGTAGTYYVFSKNSTTSCYSTGSGSVVVTINAAPATPSPSPTTLTACAPSTVDLTSTLGTAPAGTVYEWHTANNTLAGTIVSTPTSVSTSGTYYVFSKNSTTSCYSTASGSVVVTINAAPATPSPSPTTLTACAPGTVDLTSTLGTAPAGTVYEWHTANNTLAGTIVSTPTAVSSSGTYYVFSKNSTTSCYSTGSGSVVVTINAAPATPSPSPTTLTTCAPGTVDLTSTLGTAPAGTVYEWHTANNTLAGTIVSTPTAVGTAGTYYVFSKNSTTSCYSTASGSVVVTINAAPATPSPSPTTLTACAPSTVDLTSTLGTAPAGTVYEWHTANNTLAGTIVSTPSAVSTSGTYYVFSKNSTTSCYSTGSGSVVVTINAAPATPSPSPTTLTTCAPGTVDLTSTLGTAPAGTVYEWHTANNTLAGTIVSTPTAVGTAGTYYVFSKNSTTSCYSTASGSVVVTINAAPATPSPSPTTLTACAPGTVDLTSTLGTAPAGTVYEWHTANNTLAGTIVSTPTAVSTSGTYYVFSKNSTTSCYSTGSGSVVVTINAAPATPSPSPTTLTTCAPGTVDLTSTLGTAPAGTVYEWHTANNTLAGTIVSTPTAVGTAGTYYVFSKNSTTSCYSTGSGSVVVTINAAPATPSPSPTTLTTCAPGTVDLTSTLGTAPAGTVYEWHTANNTLAGTIVSTPTAVGTAGTYYVFSKNSTTSCYSTGSGSVVVTINAAPATPTATVTEQPTCAKPKGTIQVSAPTGANLSYSINGVSYQASPIFSGLAIGSTHSVTVKNTTTNCISSAITLKIDSVLICPKYETGTILSTGGTVIANVVANDTISGVQATLGAGGNATITPIGTYPSGITLNTTTGAINVASGTTPGKYPVVYQLCDKLTTITCASVTDTVTVRSGPIPVGNTAASVPNPNGTVQSANAASLFSGTPDPITGGTIASLTIIAFPTGVDNIVVNGTTYLSTNPIWPANGGAGIVIPTSATGVPTQTITVDPTAIGATSVVIPFKVTDNGGTVSLSSANVTLPFSTPIDSDGDGIPDSIDLDSDNDGILDINECPLALTQLSGFTPLNPSVIPSTGLAVGNRLLKSNAIIYLGQYYDAVVDVLEINTPTSTSAPVGTFGSIGSNMQLSYTNISLNPFVRYSVVFVPTGTAPATGTVTPSTIKGLVTLLGDIDGNDNEKIGDVMGVGATNGVSLTTVGTKLTTAGFNAGTSPTGNFTYYRPADLDGTTIVANADTPAENPLYEVTLYNDIYTTGNFVYGSTGTATANTSRGQSISFFSRYSCDTDKDGIADVLDLDSDGDGCSDAIEGGSTAISYTNLVNSSLPGGNSGVGYTGTSINPVTVNLGNTVDAFGVPTIAGASGQTVGSSQNVLVNTCPVITGNVFNDVNGLTDNTVNGLTTIPSGLKANLLNGSNNVIDTLSVNPDGTYTFKNISDGTFTVQISTNIGTIGSPAPATALPIGWVNTGEHNGASAGSDGTIDGKSSSFTVASADVTNINFGIEQAPTAVADTATAVINPGGSVQSANVAVWFSGTDLSGGIIDSLTITAFPTGATSIVVNGVNYTAGSAVWSTGGLTIPTNASGVPTQTITVDPTSPGPTSVIIPFKVIDNGGIASITIATITIPFTSFVDPVTENGTSPSTGGTAIANVTTNDMVNGVPATLGAGGNSVISEVGTYPTGISLNTTTGAVAVAIGTVPGKYPIVYQLCDKLSPITCASVTDTITVTPVINPVTENGTVTSAAGGTAIANVTTNDLVNGVPATLGAGGNSTITPIGTYPTGISLNTTTGAVTVAVGTVPGKYPIVYQLCDKLSPITCASVTDTITVTPVINPVTENGTVTSAAGGTAIANVTTNDMVNGVPATLGAGGNSVISEVGTYPTGISLNTTTGAVAVAVGTVPGKYPIVYQLCDKLSPITCASVTDTITVTPVINPVTDSGTSPSTGGTAIANVTTNDLVNGVPATLGAGGNSVISEVGTYPTGISLNTTTGAVAVAVGTVPGKYPIVYQLCDKLSPITCASVTDTITVTPVINPVTDSGTAPSTGGTAIANVTTNDMVNGVPATLGAGGNSTITPIGTYPTGISLNTTTGAVTVAVGTVPGKYPIVYQLCDKLSPITCVSITDTVIVGITIVANPDNMGSVVAGSPITHTILVNDQSNGLSASLSNVKFPQVTTLPTKGSVVINPDGSATYTPFVSSVGTDSFIYRICDKQDTTVCDTALVSVTIIELPLVQLLPRVYLQGSLFGIYLPDTLMRDDLRVKGLIPTQSPYPALGFSGISNSNTANSSVFSATGNNAIVDWVFVELRSSVDSLLVLDSRSAFVQRDGDIVDVDGVSAVTFSQARAGSYYVSVRHRNHLGVMSATALSLTGVARIVDFRKSSTATYNIDPSSVLNVSQVDVEQGKALWAGNALFDREVIYIGNSNDVNVIYQQVIGAVSNTFVTPYYKLKGYFTGDINMNGEVIFQGTTNDVEFIYQNVMKNHTGNTLKQNFFKIREQLPH